MTWIDDENGVGAAFAPQFDGQVGAAITVGSNEGGINFSVFAQERARAAALTPQFVQRLRDVYVLVSQWDEARRRLLELGAVALVGPSGSGREITAINLLAELELLPRRLLLDPEDSAKEIAVHDGAGYLVDLSVLSGSDAEDTAAVDNCLHALHEARCPVVLLSDEQTARRVSLEERGLALRIGPAPSGTVFVKELLYLCPVSDVKGWSKHPLIEQILTDALPSDSARLARLVRDVAGEQVRAPTDQQVQEVIGAYGSWRTEIEEWDAKVRDVGEASAEAAQQRALLLAAAVLEGAGAQTVLHAAGLLLDTCGIPEQPGGGLVGRALTERLQQVGAELKGDRVVFRRSAYGPAVLDWIWQERPQLRRKLPEWIARTGQGQLAAPDASVSLLELALRKRDPGLVLEVASEWVDRGMRPPAAQMLGTAALSQEIGGPVRRKLYHWARHQSGTRVQLLVAEVCAGQMADILPEITLTRLRNLARQELEVVRAEVVRTMAVLAERSRLRLPVLRETIRWTVSPHPTVAATGCRTFLALAARGGGDRGWQVLGNVPSEKDLSLVGEGWRASLRWEETRLEARALAATWLESVVAVQVPRRVVLEPLARACRSSLDVALVTELVSGWATERVAGPSAAPGGSCLDPEEILQELSVLLRGRDGLGPVRRIPAPPADASGTPCSRPSAPRRPDEGEA